jgi:hypothetical protein
VTGFDPPIIISEPVKIASAAELAIRHQDRWVDRFSNNAPLLMFEFYRDERHVGGYGIGSNYLTEGSLNRDDVRADEITALAGRLGVQWPPRR